MGGAFFFGYLISSGEFMDQVSIDKTCLGKCALSHFSHGASFYHDFKIFFEINVSK